MKIKVCKKCGKEFNLPTHIEVDGVLKPLRQDRKNCFECVPFNTYNKGGITTTTLQCDHCHAFFQRPSYMIDKYDTQFCSRQCSLAHHNKLRSIVSLNDCQVTTEQLQSSGKTNQQIRGIITSNNRQRNRELKKLPCIVCGYTKHVQLAHVRPVHTFSSSATLREINAKDNVIPLCPNHHWEYDHDLLELVDQTKIDDWLMVRRSMLRPTSAIITFGEIKYEEPR